MTEPISAITAAASHPVARSTPSAELRRAVVDFNEFSSRLFGQQMGAPVSTKNLEKAMMDASSPNDAIRSLFVMADMSSQLTASVVRLNGSMALGGAVTGLFSSLLKNRE